MFKRGLTENIIPDEIVLPDYKFIEECHKHSWVYDEDCNKCIICGVSEIIVSDIELPIEILAKIFRSGESMYFASRGCSNIIRKTCFDEILHEEFMRPIEFHQGMTIISEEDDSACIEVISEIKNWKRQGFEVYPKAGIGYKNMEIIKLVDDNGRTIYYDNDIKYVDLLSIQIEMERRNITGDFDVKRVLTDTFYYMLSLTNEYTRPLFILMNILEFREMPKNLSIDNINSMLDEVKTHYDLGDDDGKYEFAVKFKFPTE